MTQTHHTMKGLVMTNVSAFSRVSSVRKFNVAPIAFLLALDSAYRQRRALEKLDATLLADVGLSEADVRR